MFTSPHYTESQSLIKDTSKENRKEGEVEQKAEKGMRNARRDKEGGEKMKYVSANKSNPNNICLSQHD